MRAEGPGDEVEKPVNYNDHTQAQEKPMQNSVSIEQTILKNLRLLPIEKQQAVLDYTKSLQEKIEPIHKLSMSQIVLLPLAQRHQYLAPFIPQTAQDFVNNPELTEFSVLDVEDWVMDND